jgi:two-component system phosphate regulon response regulator PhoB
MAKGTILIIDDEKDVIELVRYNLEREGFDVVGALDGEPGLAIAQQHKPDLVLLDLMLPGMDGLEVCRRLRSHDRTAAIPVIMLTAKAAEADRVVGLEIGADDYIAKPFSPRELVARVKAVLRRARPVEAPSEVLRRGAIEIDAGRHEVTCAGEKVMLTATEFRILKFLARRPGRAYTRDEIIDGALGRDTAVLDRTIDVHVTALRRKLSAHGAAVETVRGVGYRFRDDKAAE